MAITSNYDDQSQLSISPHDSREIFLYSCYQYFHVFFQVSRSLSDVIDGSGFNQVNLAKPDLIQPDLRYLNSLHSEVGSVWKFPLSTEYSKMLIEAIGVDRALIKKSRSQFSYEGRCDTQAAVILSAAGSQVCTDKKQF